MICRKCSYILQGSEKFCPNCGADCSQKPETEKTEDITLPTPPSILFSAPKQQEPPPEIQQKIFREDPDDSETEAIKQKKSKAPAVLIALLIIVILSVGGFTAMEYFGLAPVIMQYLETGNTVKQDKEESTTGEIDSYSTTRAVYSANHGIVSPDVNFKPTTCYVATDKSLPLRKGPDESYAPLEQLETGCQLQVIGGSMLYDTWVYVYVPYLDLYGWLSASFLSEATALEETEEETTQINEETPDKTDLSLNSDSYTAVVISSTGVKLREGPGTEYGEILTVPHNSTVVVMGSHSAESSWLYVSFDGYSGYINSDYLKKL